MKENVVQNISAKRMERILKHDDIIWGASLSMVKGMPSHSSRKMFSCHSDIQNIINKHSVLFGDMPRGLPPQRGFDVMSPTLRNLVEGTTFVTSLGSLICLLKWMENLLPIILTNHTSWFRQETREMNF